MKKLFFLAAIAGFSANSVNAQITVTYPATADAPIWQLADDCILQGNPAPFSTTPGDVNFGANTELNYMAWTWRGDGDLEDPKQDWFGCREGTFRSLIRFDDIERLPACAHIISANIHFYGIPSSACSGCWDTWPSPASGYLINNGIIRKITQPWDEMVVTWNNFGATTDASIDMGSGIAIPPSASNWGWNPLLDVTSFVQDIVDGQPNLGWQLALKSETRYRRVVFASREYPDRALRPVLEINYASRASFKYCVTSAPSNIAPYSQLLYNMSAEFAAPTGMTYEWSVDNTVIGTGANISYQVPYQTTGSISICLKLRDEDGNVICEKCHDACIFKPDTYSGDLTNNATFTICKSTMNPDEAICTIDNMAAGTYVWTATTSGAVVPVQTQTGGSTFIVNSSGVAPIFKVVELQHYPPGSPVETNIANICFNENTAGRPAPGIDRPKGVYGIEQAEPDNMSSGTLTISPNPTTTGWKVVFAAREKQGKARLNLYNIMGKLVSGQEQLLHPGSNTAEVSGDHIAPGVYILEVSQGNSVIKEKVIKLK